MVMTETTVTKVTEFTKADLEELRALHKWVEVLTREVSDLNERLDGLEERASQLSEWELMVEMGGEKA